MLFLCGNNLTGPKNDKAEGPTHLKIIWIKLTLRGHTQLHGLMKVVRVVLKNLAGLYIKPKRLTVFELGRKRRNVAVDEGCFLSGEYNPSFRTKVNFQIESKSSILLLCLSIFSYFGAVLLLSFFACFRAKFTLRCINSLSNFFWNFLLCLFFWNFVYLLKERWIGTRELRSLEQKHLSMKTRLGLRVKGGCETISHMQ